MAYNTPQETAAAAVESGVTKGNMSLDKMVVGGFLAGAYIAFGSLLAVAVTSGLNTAQWGTLPTLVFGAVFSVGLVLVILAGAELLTGNMMLLPIAALRGRVSLPKIAINWTVLFIANFVGSLFVAYFLAVKTGVIGTSHSDHASTAYLTFTRLSGIAKGKAITETHYEVFLRAVGCNWLVCLGVWLAIAAKDVGGKILGIFFPIMAFVAMGFDHVVANMFFLPAAMFAHVPGITAANTAWNLLMALLGNIVGAVIFVSGAYWFLYLRGGPATASGTGPESRAAGMAEPAGMS
ncbi:MAG: formate/nitrite transporter [Mycobacterium sp.]|nr:formate/nitrite transporter [Mycobacterium sp.]